MQIKYVFTRLLEGLEDNAQKLVLAPAVPAPKAWSALEGRGRDERVWVSSNLTLQVKVGRLWRFFIRSPFSAQPLTSLNLPANKGGLWVKPVRRNHCEG